MATRSTSRLTYTQLIISSRSAVQETEDLGGLMNDMQVQRKCHVVSYIFVPAVTGTGAHTSAQQPAIIKPSTLVIGVSEESILYKLIF